MKKSTNSSNVSVTASKKTEDGKEDWEKEGKGNYGDDLEYDSPERPLIVEKGKKKKKHKPRQNAKKRAAKRAAAEEASNEAKEANLSLEKNEQADGNNVDDNAVEVEARGPSE